MKELDALNNCKIIDSHQGTLFRIDKEHFDLIAQVIEELNENVNYYTELEKQVEKSRKNSSKERKRRLDRKKYSLPEKIEITTYGFKRDPDVIAEVLERANGICEECKKTLRLSENQTKHHI